MSTVDQHRADASRIALNLQRAVAEARNSAVPKTRRPQREKRADELL